MPARGKGPATITTALASAAVTVAAVLGNARSGNAPGPHTISAAALPIDSWVHEPDLVESPGGGVQFYLLDAPQAAASNTIYRSAQDTIPTLRDFVTRGSHH